MHTHTTVAGAKGVGVEKKGEKPTPAPKRGEEVGPGEVGRSGSKVKDG